MQTRTPTSSKLARPQETGVVLYYDPPVYHHTSTFRYVQSLYETRRKSWQLHLFTISSRCIELIIRSPSTERVEDPKFIGQSIPVFYGKDSVGGTVVVTVPAVISTEHQLAVSIEGAFFWIAPQKEQPQSLPLSPPLPKRIKHVFLSSSFTFPLSPSPLNSHLKPSISIRSVFQDGIRKTLFRRTPSRSRRDMGKTVLNGNPQDSHAPSGPEIKAHNFSFPLPVIIGRKIPSTISVSRLSRGGIRGRWYAEGAQVAYKLTAHLYPVAAGVEDMGILEEQLEAPIFIDSSDSSDLGEEHDSRSWSHSTFTCLKNLPFLCTLALPRRASFPRNGTITFYVVFWTLPKSEALARRIIKGASIRVSLVRQLRLDPGITIPVPVSDKSQKTQRQRERSSSPPNPVESRLPKIFTWQKKPNEPVWPSQSSASREQTKNPSLKDKPLPTLPSESNSVYEHVMCTVVSNGFPKRVVHKEPSLSFESSSGPEGIFRGELRLSNELSNTIDWPGISLSYFVEANVHFENDVVRARDRVRLAEAYI